MQRRAFKPAACAAHAVYCCAVNDMTEFTQHSHVPPSAADCHEGRQQTVPAHVPKTQAENHVMVGILWSNHTRRHRHLC
jgi:hypothetical protein